MRKSCAASQRTVVIVPLESHARPRVPEAVKIVAPWLVFLILFVIPLYIISATIVIRMDLFQFDNNAISDEQMKALWAFVATGLGTAATITGALLSYQHNRRTQAIQEQADALKRQREDEAVARDERAQQEKQRLDEEAAARMTLETVVKGLELITLGDDYAPQARISGALVTMVQLNQELVAMRILAILWRDHKVDNDTATWLIGKVIVKNPTSASAQEAASLIYQHASELTDSNNKGFYSWPDLPDGVMDKVTFQPKALLVVSVAKILISQDRSWWEQGYGWIYRFMRSALKDQDVGIAMMAANLMQPLLEDYQEFGLSDYLEVKDEVAQLLEDQGEIPLVIRDQVEAIGKWYIGGKAQAQPSTSANVPIIAETTPPDSHS